MKRNDGMLSVAEIAVGLAFVMAWCALLIGTICESVYVHWSIGILLPFELGTMLWSLQKLVSWSVDREI